jgi:hypothetical protein
MSARAAYSKGMFGVGTSSDWDAIRQVPRAPRPPAATTVRRSAESLNLHWCVKVNIGLTDLPVNSRVPSTSQSGRRVAKDNRMQLQRRLAWTRT